MQILRKPVDRAGALWFAGMLLVATAAGPLVVMAPAATFGVVGGILFLIVALVRPKVIFGVGLIVVLAQRTLSLHVPGALVDGSDEAFVIVCAMLFPLHRAGQGKALRGLPGGVPLAIFLALGITGSVLNDVTLSITMQGVLLIAKGFLLAWAVAQLDWSHEDLRRLVKIGAWVAVILIIGAAINLLAPGPWATIVPTSGSFGTRWGLEPVTSFFQHPGYFGTTMAMTSIAAVAYAMVFRLTGAAAFIIVGSVAAAFLTARRKILVGMVASLGLIGLRQRVSTTVVTIIFAAPLVLLIGWQFINTIIAFTADEYLANPDDTARVRLTTDSISLAGAAFPLGEGFGRFGSAAARLNYSPLYDELGYRSIWGLGPTEENGKFLTDTFWPAIVGETGYIGTLCFVLALVAAFRVFMRLAKQDEPWDKWLGLVGMGWSVQMLVESVAGAVYTAVPTFAVYFALVGIATARAADLGLRTSIRDKGPATATKKRANAYDDDAIARALARAKK